MASKYADMTVDELREEGRRRELSGIWDMTKDELVTALERADGGGDRAPRADEGDGGRDEGKEEVRINPSEDTKYSQEIRTVDEHEERPGRSLVTRNHEVIRRWAQERDATPATVPGTEHGDRLGVLRFDFPGYGGQDLRHVSWDEWFQTFDERGLNFMYQEHTKDGSTSNFFRLENPDRSDA